ncbi:MAG: dephospho-CoA kinase [Tissierellia bacterium]|nr:dephospho-CoA kinase [Tissierellia bacterium]
MNQSRRVVITGSIATGKSTVTRMLIERGYPVLDADRIAGGIYEDHALLSRVRAHFGETVLTAEGKLDRKKLGERIFRDAKERKVLNRMTHPVIIKRMLQEEKSVEGDLVFWDVPLYFEERDVLEPLIQPTATVLVYATFEQQLQRLQIRDALGYEEALERIKAQIPIEQKRKMADYILDNSRGIVDLSGQLTELLPLLEANRPYKI